MSGSIQERRRRFEELALPHAGILYGVATRLASRAQDAEELVQDTFLRAYRTFDNFEPGTNEKAWLFTILYSIDKNRRRTAGRRPREQPLEREEHGAIAEPEAEGWGSHLQVLRDIEAGQLSRVMADAVAALPADWQEALFLVVVEELSYEEAARILECPPGTVGSRLYRARRQLSESLAPQFRDRNQLKGRCVDE